MSRSGYHLGAALLGALAVACRKTPVEPRPCPGAAQIAAQVPSSRPSPFDSIFAAAGAEFGVPPALLRAIGWVETRWQMVVGAEEFPGRPAAFGAMALRGAALERGATLAGVTPEAVRRDPVANIRAAAALLAAYASESSIDQAIVRYSGIDISAGRAAYQREIDRVLGVLVPQGVSAACPPPVDTAAPDYAPGVWRASPNFNVRPSDSTGRVHMVIVHTCESNYASCWSWLVNPVSQVSAHYVVNEDGGDISQLVREPDRGWHIAAPYRCALNLQHDCWLNDVQSNDFTVGIEHAGFVSQDSFPVSQLDASARLVCDITRDRGIPRDWQHIVGHGQLQPENRTDPGPKWPWIAYIHRIQARCREVVVDDSSQFNDAGVAMSVVPATWPATQQTSDYYGGGYRFASTQPDATDGAAFTFRLDSAGARTLDVRWTSGTNRSPRAAYVVVSATGDTLGVVSVDQRTGGGAWHELGMWTFPAGWSRVVLTRRDTAGTVVVADAVRVR